MTTTATPQPVTLGYECPMPVGSAGLRHEKGSGPLPGRYTCKHCGCRLLVVRDGVRDPH